MRIVTSATTLGISRAKFWLSVIVGLSILLPALPEAATGTLAPVPYQTVFDANGDPISGACIWTYTAGTTTPVATYTDVNLSVANANPIVADSAGRFVAYLTQGVSYKFAFETACTAPAHGTTIKTSDNIASVPGNASGVDVLGTAGEALTAGNAVYLSDGSGSKTQGSWYKADTTNAYSSTLPFVGMVPASISSSASGAIRVGGQMTGLSSLSVGADYYLSTSGAITSTVPAARRWVGRADSTTTLVLNPDPPPLVAAVVDDFRLTVSTATCVPTSDVTGASAATIYLTPCTGNRITLADSTGALTTYTTAEISIAIPAVASQMYDVWVFANSGVPALEVLAWTNDTTRATAIARTTTNFYTKSGDLTRRYVGSFRTTTVAGQTEDSKTARYLWNYYNRAERSLFKVEATASWAYNTDTIRNANNAGTNLVAFAIGVSEEPVFMHIGVTVTQATASNNAAVCVGQDSLTTCASGQTINFANMIAGTGGVASADYRVYLAAGFHFLAWNEDAEANGTTTFYGTTQTVGGIAALAASTTNGMIGYIKN